MEPSQCANAYEEFSGTLLGFDDYVSEYPCMRSATISPGTNFNLDMVMEDVTELYVFDF
jgi:hypothetical protein